MKTPSWQKCNHGSMGTHPSTNGKMLLPNDPVISGMHVTAKFRDEIINLKIAEEIKPDVFKAVVIGSYFLNSSNELNTGDEVSVDREYICTIFSD